MTHEVPFKIYLAAPIGQVPGPGHQDGARGSGYPLLGAESVLVVGYPVF